MQYLKNIKGVTKSSSVTLLKASKINRALLRHAILFALFSNQPTFRGQVKARASPLVFAIESCLTGYKITVTDPRNRIFFREHVAIRSDNVSRINFAGIPRRGNVRLPEYRGNETAETRVHRVPSLRPSSALELVPVVFFLSRFFKPRRALAAFPVECLKTGWKAESG